MSDKFATIKNAKTLLLHRNKRIAELELTCAEQAKRITELEEQYQEECRENFDAMWERQRAEAECDKLRKALWDLLESVKGMREYLDDDFDIPEVHHKIMKQAEAVLSDGE